MLNVAPANNEAQPAPKDISLFISIKIFRTSNTFQKGFKKMTSQIADTTASATPENSQIPSAWDRVKFEVLAAGFCGFSTCLSSALLSASYYTGDRTWMLAAPFMTAGSAINTVKFTLRARRALKGMPAPKP